MPDRVEIMGLEIDAVTEPEVVDHVVESAADRRGGWVITPNLDQLRQHRERPDVRDHFRDADVVVADGMPLVWASRLAGTPLPERVAGSALIWSVAKAGSERELDVFLLGGNPGAAEQAAARLEEEAPGLRIAGTHCPPQGFEHDTAELAQIDRAVADADPAILFVGLPFPKQELVIQRLRARFRRTWFLGVGVSLSLVAGDVRRAPAWMQRTGMEWVWRIAQEPRRLARRYLVDGLPFAARLLGWGAAARFRPDATRS